MTMFKATTAAAALLPIQKNPNLFHILINPCEFLIESRASSWGPGALGSRAAGGPEGLGLIAGTEKRFTMSASGVITGTGDTAVSKARRLLPSGAFSLWGNAALIKHSYRPGKTQYVCE